jgi:hypothetical protein
MGERYRGLIPLLLGIGMLAMLQLWSRIDAVLPRPEPPPGFPASGVLLVNPIACLLPLLMIGAVALVVVGLFRLLFPSDDSRARELREGEHERDPDGGPNLIP